MATKRCAVKVTANFEANLNAIGKFLADAKAGSAFDALLNDLAEHLIPALEYHPNIDRAFLEREAQSVEARQRIRQLTLQIGAMSLREYIAGDFLILYAVKQKSVYLLSLKHHRQLSFDLSSNWR